MMAASKILSTFQAALSCFRPKAAVFHSTPFSQKPAGCLKWLLSYLSPLAAWRNCRRARAESCHGRSQISEARYGPHDSGNYNTHDLGNDQVGQVSCEEHEKRDERSPDQLMGIKISHGRSSSRPLAGQSQSRLRRAKSRTAGNPHGVFPRPAHLLGLPRLQVVALV
jgi:hypothetical protein